MQLKLQQNKAPQLITTPIRIENVMERDENRSSNSDGSLDLGEHVEDRIRYESDEHQRKTEKWS